MSHVATDEQLIAEFATPRGLADTIAALVSILIGGLIWWILLIVALLLQRRYMRSRNTKA